jgi:hypothetical protein
LGSGQGRQGGDSEAYQRYVELLTTKPTPAWAQRRSAYWVNKGGTAETYAFAPCFGAEAFLLSLVFTKICGTIEQINKGRNIHHGKKRDTENHQDF